MPDSAAARAKRHVLLVEDEASIRELVTLHLSLAGFEVTGVGDGSRAMELVRSTSYDLLILDVLLPGLDGITLCRAARSDSANRATPILMLTALDSESDTVLGLESGADDYLTKPFGVRELLARVAAILRRGAPLSERAEGASGRRLERGDLVLDPERREAVVRGHVVELTKQEFELAYLLASRPGVVYSRSALMAKVWSGDTYVTERTVDTVVSRLRRKLERDPQDPELLLTAWGVGYKFADVE
jgi:two-component system OmpR family response regulator